MVYWKNVFYGITPGGDVHWHQFLGVTDGSAKWHSKSGTKIGDGFGGYTRMFGPGGAGVLYGVKANGDLHIHIHDRPDEPSSQWTASSGRKISHGWDALRLIVPVQNTFYAAKPNSDDVLWYRVDNWPSSPPSGAAGDIGKKVMTGWQPFDTVFATSVRDGTPMGTAVFYGRQPNGDLYWTRHDGWADGEPMGAGYGWRKVGDGWNIYRQTMTGVIVDAPPVIYGLTDDGVLRWYRHDGALAGTPAWTAGDGGRKIGDGFDRYSTVVCGAYGIYRIPILSRWRDIFGKLFR